MNVEIAERLARKRRERGLSQEDLAGQLGVSRQAVSKWERSESSPDTDNLIALARLYGTSLDELLYLDEELEDDMVFEAEDRAPQNEAADPAASQRASSASGAPIDVDPCDVSSADPSEVPSDAEGTTSKGTTGKKGEGKVHIGPDGINVVDGEDRVHLSWSEGVHVKSADGDEVHVGWDGIHVNDKGNWWKQEGTDGSCASSRSRGHHHDWNGVDVNGTHYDSWHDARDAWKYTWEGKSKKNAWQRFPFSAVVLIAYLAAGIWLNAWGPALLLVFAIPLYYIVVDGISRKRYANMLAGFYPVAVTAWFCWMAFVAWQPHPAWMVFLTIPFVDWAVMSIGRWYRRTKHAASEKHEDREHAKKQ
jgi:transcriptional regulator with XRE-family HTH domain